jgi:phosphatidylethanolamine/phosphatidyl-N-methylethanolamine N-methyltransferase
MHEEDEAWLAYRQKFSEVYDDSNYASPLQSRVMGASHKLVEKAYGSQVTFGRVLEIGAGTGEHLPYVRHRFENYVLNDADPKTLQVAQQKLAGLHAGKLLFEPQQGDGLSYDSNSFDRVIATHVLEHIYKPHLALKEWIRVLKPGGTLSILIPTDPGVAWRLGRHFGPRKNSIAQGIAYDYVMAREHVNSCNNLIAILRHYFPRSEEAWWPLPIPTIDLNLFFSFHAVVDKAGRY